MITNSNEEYTLFEFILDILSIVLHILLLIGLFSASGIWTFYEGISRPIITFLINSSTFLIYHLSLVAFLFSRVIWSVIRIIFGLSKVDYFIGNISFLLFFTLFSILAVYWIHLYHKRYFGWGRLLRFVPWFLIALNVILYLFVIATTIAFVASSISYKERSNSIPYHLSLAGICLFNVVFIIGCFGYVIRFIVYVTCARAKRDTIREGQVIHIAEFIIIIGKILLFALSLILMLVAITYRNIDERLHPIAFWTMAVLLPTTIILVVHAIYLYLIKYREKRRQDFISSLYASDLRDAMIVESEEYSEPPTSTPKRKDRISSIRSYYLN